MCDGGLFEVQCIFPVDLPVVRRSVVTRTVLSCYGGILVVRCFVG